MALSLSACLHREHPAPRLMPSRTRFQHDADTRGRVCLTLAARKMKVGDKHRKKEGNSDVSCPPVSQGALVAFLELPVAWH